MQNKLEKFLVDMTYKSTYEFFEQGNSNELERIAKKRGIELPTPDLAFFKTVYALVGSENLNFCTLPQEEVSKSLNTLIGKSIDLNHWRKTIVGTWIDCQLVGNKIIAWGTFYKSSLAEDYIIIKELLQKGELFVSMEAWGNREYIDDKSYNLTDICFAGGALLIDLNPACPEAEVLELSKKQRILEMASTMTRPKEFVHEKGKQNDTNINKQETENKEKGGSKNDMLKNLFEKVEKSEDISFDMALRFYNATDEEKKEIPEEAQGWTQKVIEEIEAKMQKASKESKKTKAAKDPKEDKAKKKEKASYDIWDIDTISRIMWEVECPTCKVVGCHKITMLDFVNSKAQVECYDDGTVIEVDLKPATKIIKKGKTEAKIKEEAHIVKDLLKKYEKAEDTDASEFAKFLDGELVTAKESKVEVDTKLTEAETKVTDAEAKVTEVESKLADANTELAAIKEAAEKAGVKVEELAADIEGKIKVAREEAKTIAERKGELGEFAKDMSDEDLLSDDKFNLAKKDKELAKTKKDLEDANEKIKHPEKAAEKPDLVVGSEDKEVVDEVVAATKRVADKAYPLEG